MFKRQTIYEGTVGVKLRNGLIVGTLGPGRYWLRRGAEEVSVYPLGVQTEMIGGQEVMTSDGATVRVSLALDFRIEDALIYRRSYPVDPDNSRGNYAYAMLFSLVQKPEQRLHQKAQMLFREALTTKTLAEALELRASLTASFLEPLQTLGKEIGVAVEAVNLLDLNIAGNVRAAYSDLLKAELEGKAALQRARNEAGTMRNLLNTARLVREHPGLLELRALSMGQKPRISFVVGQTRPTGELPADDEA